MSSSRSNRHVRLNRAFFGRNTIAVASDLLGKRLVSRIGGERVSGIIAECEAYVIGDSTSHAARGQTPRTTPMFGKPGVAYVYFTYGMHYCMNLVTEPVGNPTAILIRALVPEQGIEVMRARRGPSHSDRDLCRGPARLCVALGIDRAVTGMDTIARDATVFVEEAEVVRDEQVVRGPRVGVVGTASDVIAPLRFYLRDSKYVSNGPRTPK